MPRDARLIGVLLVLSLAGCTRQFWRQNADFNAYGLTREKQSDPRWALPRIDLTPNPASRFYDPYDPDFSPLPPDDPTAHRDMHDVYGMRGYKGWHKWGDLPSVENPQWLEPFGLAPEQLAGQVPLDDAPGLQGLTLPQAVELATIHSRDFQFQLENLFLAALDLSFQRFRFNVRYLGVSNRRPTNTLTYQDVPGTQDSLANSATFGVSQLLPTGAQWAVEMANNTLWLFSGDNSSSTASLLSYSLVQPLLLNGGRRFTLENLTQSERNLLYAVRTFARFRQQFFVATVSGGSSGSSAYLGLLRQRQGVLNTQSNIVSLEAQVERLRALASQKPVATSEFLDALPADLQIPAGFAERLRYDPQTKLLSWVGEMTQAELDELLALSNDADFQAAVREIFSSLQSEPITLDVAQLETRLATTRTTLLNSQRAFQDALDGYKIQLGLPPNLPVTLDESLLQSFVLIDPRLTQLQKAMTEFVLLWAAVDDANPPVAELQSVVEELARLQQRIVEEAVNVLEQDFARIEADRERRLAELPDDLSRERYAADVERARQLFDGARTELEEFEAAVRKFRARLKNKTLPLAERQAIHSGLADLREEILKRVQNLTVIQISLRVDLIPLNPFPLGIDDVVRIALEQRVDLMNARALVMDARRKIEVFANQLQAGVDVKVEGGVATPPLTTGHDKPFDFRGSDSSFRAGVSFTAPLDQVQQRNAYRTSIITYQRARRDYMLAEDNVKFAVRQSWRQLTALRQAFENSRRAVRMAAIQFDQSAEQLTAPVQPGQQRTSGTLGLNLLNALSSVLDAQNSLISTWADYETSRLNIHRDMGTMGIDEFGMWDDDYYQALRATQDGVVVPKPAGEFLPPTIVPPGTDDVPPAPELP